ncbi:MAG: helix-hairpin-helix domain-containing protein [Flavobacterium sp.]|uniref:helix-hairpin-helix domain-containing protein n=1 Tax=Flavobacterium sp. TaxID=239 RepID=UPI0022C4A990|nr:helix-hairpin-helix domain-containing protein [Flavobacterium sp.]MCZ8198109.1 helix-hairpin-helix domain-containing protein [Flavobacterium sp.]
MDYKATIKSYFNFTKSQRLGLVLLLTLIVVFQIAFYFIDFSQPEKNASEKQQWLALQSEIDSLKQNVPTSSYKIYPFNPNFITDFKGYKLGMTVEQIDRLLAFRKQGKFANSPKEFQQVTGISDSLLNAISPYFKFPDWVNKKNSGAKSNWVDYSKTNYYKKEKVVILDINSATKEDLMKVYGIGDGLSERILKQKEVFGEFVSMEQMSDVWGLSPEVIEKLNQSFKIINNPKIKKVNINNASIKELGQFPYFRYPISKNIVTYRSMNGDIKIEDLTKIKDFPVDKIKIIALYLEF